jgi:hypothetical protein
MAPRANWKGYLRLSLVSCPIALYPASSLSEKVSFNRINRKTGNRLKQQNVDSETGAGSDTTTHKLEVPPTRRPLVVERYPLAPRCNRHGRRGTRARRRAYRDASGRAENRGLARGS